MYIEGRNGRLDKKLRTGFQKVFSFRFFMILMMGVIIIGSSIYLDGNQDCKIELYQWFKLNLAEDKIHLLKQIRNIARLSVRDYGSMVINYTAILMAAVIFFYSVSDNKRVGIPHRTIIAYSIGSMTIPFLFLVSLVLSLFIYCLEYAGYNLTFVAGVLYTLFLQSFVIVEILWSTSFRETVKVVRCVEIKQYKNLKKLDDTSYAFLYVLRHMEHAFMSGEMTPDKVMLAKELLGIPLTSIKYNEKRIWKNEDKFLYELEHLYSFYYENIVAVLHHFRGKEDRDTRNTVYMMLYEFLNDLRKNRQKYSANKHVKLYFERLSKAHVMVISGMMNAVQFCAVEEADSFCSYVLNYCIEDLGMIKQQRNLYILFQEMRFAINDASEPYKSEIKELKEWERIVQDDVTELAFFWKVWVKQYSLTAWKKGEHFWRAMQTMRGYGNFSNQISYIIMKIEQMKKEFGNDESKNYSVN